MTAAVTPAAAAPAWLRAAPAIFLVMWSSGFVFVKLGLADADPLTFLALRCGAAVAMLLVLAVILRPPLPRTLAAWRHLATVGLLIQALFFSFTHLALKLGLSAGGIALITALQPILVGLLAPALAGERIGRVQWAGLLLGVAGAIVVIGARGGIATGSVAAVFCAVGALFAITIGTLYEKRYGTPHHPITANLVQFGVGLAVTLPLAAAVEPMHVAWTPTLIGALLYLVIGNSLIAISLLLAMIRFGEAARVSALFFLVPPTTAIIAWLVLGERLPLAAWLGIALAAGGLALAMRPTRRKA